MGLNTKNPLIIPVRPTVDDAAAFLDPSTSSKLEARRRPTQPNGANEFWQVCRIHGSSIDYYMSGENPPLGRTS